MRSCIAVFYIALFSASAIVSAQDNPDTLYRNRATIEQARSAAAIWERRLQTDTRDFESAWKLARVCYWLGNHEAQESARRAALERGITAGGQAVSMHADRPEGHFWIAANMGTLAESFGRRQGLQYRGDIKSELETVLRIEPGFQKGSADRALGRWYFKVPGLFGGSNKKSEEHLRKSLTYGENTVSHYFLAETLFDLNRDKEAIEELKKVLTVPTDPEWEPEDREYRQKATELLKQKQR